MPRRFDHSYDRSWRLSNNIWYRITSSTGSTYDDATAGWWFDNNFAINNFSSTTSTTNYIRTYDGYRIPRFTDRTNMASYSRWHFPEDHVPEERLLREGEAVADAIRDANRDLQLEEHRRYREERRERENQAYLRATSLLHDSLAPEQLEQLKEYDSFLVIGSQTQRVYEITIGREHNVYVLVDGYRVRRYCAHVVDRLPDADNVLAQKLMIECNEQMFLRMANTVQLPRSVPSPIPMPEALQAASF